MTEDEDFQSGTGNHRGLPLGVDTLDLTLTLAASQAHIAARLALGLEASSNHARMKDLADIYSGEWRCSESAAKDRSAWRRTGVIRMMPFNWICASLPHRLRASCSIHAVG